jgi:hypothetical protein
MYFRRSRNVSVSKEKWIIKGEVPSELLFGVLCTPQGGTETTTPSPTRLSKRELARLKNQDRTPSKRSRRKNKPKR